MKRTTPDGLEKSDKVSETEETKKVKVASGPPEARCEEAQPLPFSVAIKPWELLTYTFIMEGETRFSEGDVTSALHSYTRALHYAKYGSIIQYRCHCHFRRIQCHIKLRNWRKCIQECELFAKIDCGGEHLSILQRVKAECLKLLREEENLRFSEMMYTLKNESETIPGARKFVGIGVDPVEPEVKGRRVNNNGVAPIEPGALILVDKAAFHAPTDSLKKGESKSCNNCLRKLDEVGGGIPCKTLCGFACYCLEECATSEHARIHSRYECKILAGLSEMKQFPGAVRHIALGSLLKLGPEALLNYLRQGHTKQESEENKNNRIPGMNSDGVYCISYDSLTNLSAIEKPTDADLNDSRVFADAATKLLDEKTDFFSSLKKQDPNLDLARAKEVFHEKLCLIQLKNSSNFTSVTRYTSAPPPADGFTLPQVEADITGTALFPVASLINHSCDPNVAFFSLPGGAMAVVALQHVAPGQEFFTSYGPHFRDTEWPDRRVHLQSEFGFVCRCTACLNRWESKPLQGPLTCPNCRRNIDIDSKGIGALDNIKWEPTETSFLCGKCGLKSKPNKFEGMLEKYEKVATEAISQLNGRELKKAFVTFQSYVSFLGASFPRTLSGLAEKEETLKLIYGLGAAKLWERR